MNQKTHYIFLVFVQHIIERGMICWETTSLVTYSITGRSCDLLTDKKKVFIELVTVVVISTWICSNFIVNLEVFVILGKICQRSKKNSTTIQHLLNSWITMIHFYVFWKLFMFFWKLFSRAFWSYLIFGNKTNLFHFFSPTFRSFYDNIIWGIIFIGSNTNIL